MIKKKINKLTLSKKLNAMYDYLIQLEVNNIDDTILLRDRHGIESFQCENEYHPRSNQKETIKHNIDRRELIKKLKAMTESIIYITFDNILHEITLLGIRTKEQSIYYCTSDEANTKEETYGIFNWFK